MAGPTFAVFTDGQPLLVSLDQLRELIGVADLQRQLAAYAAGAEDRLTTVAGMSAQGLQEARADLLRTFDELDPIKAQFGPIQAQFGPITSDISALKQTDIGFDLALGTLGQQLGDAALSISALELADVKASDALSALVGVVADQDEAQRQLDRSVGRVEESLLRAVLANAQTRDILRDAGVVIDPISGTVRIYAIDQLKDRTSLVELSVDSVKSTLTQKATVNYVNEQIALAVLDPSQVAQLEPILARLTQAETTVDGLNAAVQLKASIAELTALAARVRTAEINVDALNGKIGLLATADAVDRLTLRTSSIEQTLTAMPDTAGLIVEVRQARGTADANADALLRSLAAGETAGRYQVSQIALARQELSTRMDDGFSAAATAQTLLSVRIDQANALMLSQADASVTRDAALTQRIDAQAAILGDQSAAIGRIDRAVLDAAGGVASSQMTIRQIVGAAGDTGEALLRSIAAGEQAGQVRAAQLVQIQTDFSTSLIADRQASAIAQQAILARMNAAEAAIVTTSKVLADTTGAYGSRIAAMEVALADPVTGLAATRVRINAVDDASATRDAALGTRVDGVEAIVNDQVTGLPATRAALTAGLKAASDRTSALTEQFQSLVAELHDPTTGLAATYANLVTTQKAQVDGDRALGERIDAVGVAMNGQSAAIGRLEQASITAAAGIASAQMTIRQAVGAAGDSGEALLRALAAGEQAGQARAAQLVQVQTEFSTTLVAGQRSEAAAREALYARLGLAEAAIVTTSKALTDSTQATTNRIAALEAAFNDPVSGLPATRSRIVAVEDATAKADAALAHRLDLTEAVANDTASGLEATKAVVAQDRQASADRDAANAHDVQQLSAQVNDAATGLPATAAALAQEKTASADRDSARGRQIDLITTELHDPSTGLPATRAVVAQDRQASADRDAANARDIQQLSSQVNDPASGLAATAAGLALERTTSADRAAALSKLIEILTAELHDPGTGLPATRATVATNKQAQVDGDQALGQLLQQVSTTQDGHTSTINFLLRSIDGKEAVAQLTLDVDGKITGFRINGQDSVFAVAADKFIVGASQIFEVDATSGIVRMRNAIIGTANIDTLNIRGQALSNTVTSSAYVSGVTADAAQTSDPVSISATGGTVRIDVCVQGIRAATGAGALQMQLFRSDGTALSGVYKCPSGADSAPVMFFAIDRPDAGNRGYYVAYSVSSGNGAAAYNVSQSLVITELKR